MRYRHHTPDDRLEIVRLFARVFSESEGQEERAVIGALADSLLETTNNEDFFNVVSDDGGQLAGFVARQ